MYTTVYIYFSFQPFQTVLSSTAVISKTTAALAATTATGEATAVKRVAHNSALRNFAPQST
jgi:hypothetical protein